MIEDYPRIENEKDERGRRVMEIVGKVREISGVIFRFPGIKPDVLLRMESVDNDFPDVIPDRVTPIGELLKRFANEGMKVVLGEHPDSGNVFILPAGSNDIEKDGIFLRQLIVDETMDERLKVLISMIESLRCLP